MPSPKGLNLKVDLQTRGLNLGKSFISAEISALNKTAAQLKTYAGKTIREEYNISAKAMRSALSVEQARKGKLFSMVRGSGRRIPLAEYGARQTSAGISVAVMKGRRFTIPATFLAIPRSGANIGVKGAYVRVHLLDNPAKRYPLRRLFGPSIPQIFVGLNMKPKIEDFIDDKLPEILDHEYQFFLQKGIL